MDILSILNPQQRQAVSAPPGPTLILAGPGSGKTRVLTHRIAYLVGHLGVEPRAILAVTFTNKAAREMRTRVESLLGGQLRGLAIGTFHSICARWLRREAAYLPVTADYVIFDESDQLALVKQVVKELNLNDKQYAPSKMLNKISAAKNELIGPEEYSTGSYYGEVIRRVYTRYQQLLTLNNALDFDDLLVSVVRLFEQQPEVLRRYQERYEHILVDEFQDTNTAQYAMLRHLAHGNKNLYAVGDPDQSIYRWRGADYRNVRKFQEDFPEATTLLLEENYRSTQLILDAAMAVIDPHPGRTPKQLYTQRQGGVKLYAFEAYNEQDEAQFVIDTIAELTRTGEAEPGGCAVMYRTNAQSRSIEEAFVNAGLPYRLVGAQRFYGRKEIKDLIAYLRLIHNPADSVSLLRAINTPPRGVGAKTLEQLLAVADQSQQPATGVLRSLAEDGRRSAFAGHFTGRAGQALAEFGHLLNNWLRRREDSTVAELIDMVIDNTGFADFVNDGSEEGMDRWENVLELRRVAAGDGEVSPTLGEFLETVTLVSDQDTLADDNQAPTLLTLHAAKGLEFPVVFIVGLDEGLLPHQRSFDDPEAMHEERRLMYVGMTRAKDRLYLVRAFRRALYGDAGLSEPSRFLDDIPDTLLGGNVARKQARAEKYFQKVTRWDSAPAPAVVTRYRSGQRVRHKLFGEGIVIDSRVSGGEEEVNVAFEAVGLKRLVASVANLEILKG